MAIGLYIHVPFCVKKCNYCDFISYPYDAGLAASYVCALEREMSMHVVNMCCEHREVKSVYLGGGTPTTLSGDQISFILDSCRRHFTLAGDAEITIECNPCTADVAKFTQLRQAGINRVSIGVQAVQQQLLSVLGRAHNWDEVVDALKSCRMAGFDNLSFDLIFGIPGQSMRNWQETLQRVTDLAPEHISAYNLKIEPDTPLYRDVTAGYLVPCDEELELEMFWHTIEFLGSRGFGHYEISNFAQPGREAQHNLIYWHNEEYLGLGPAAHSMLNGHRFSNVESVESYISRLAKKDSVVRAMYCLSEREKMSETVFLGLRLIKGLDMNIFEQKHGQPISVVYGKQIEYLKAIELVEIKDNHLKLTKKGLPLANEVFAEFI